jgi:protein-L-isoaspartate(D-aspartate) O-methyltransferase
MSLVPSMSPTVTAAEVARLQMVDQQIRAWDVLDSRVLDAMRDVRREDFVPDVYRSVAFADFGIPLEHGQSMLSPKFDGRVLQALDLQPTDQVLEIGSGSGYLAACMGKLAAHVRSLEIFPDLAERARRNCHLAAVNSVAIEIADVFQLTTPQLGEQRYNAIAVTGSLPLYDERFQNALKIGGRLVVFVGSTPMMEAIKITRVSTGQFSRETLFETVIEPLQNAPQPPHFIF